MTPFVSVEIISYFFALHIDYTMIYFYIIYCIGDIMIENENGIPLTSGNGGRNCLANGRFFDKQGKPIESCCDECDYLMCCVGDYTDADCRVCDDPFCPHSQKA